MSFGGPPGGAYKSSPYQNLPKQGLQRPREHHLSSSELQPILENKNAQAVHLEHLKMPRSIERAGVTSTRRSIVTALSDPDNGIVFLNDEDQIWNPRNEKTPPPPLFGEVLEEDLYDDSIPFYDHDDAMAQTRKRKIRL